MKILLKKESDWKFNEWVEIEYAEDVLNLVKEYGSLIFQEELTGLNENGEYCEAFGATIYDDYVE